jgi:hypothetical protein
VECKQLFYNCIMHGEKVKMMAIHKVKLLDVINTKGEGGD